MVDIIYELYKDNVLVDSQTLPADDNGAVSHVVQTSGLDPDLTPYMATFREDGTANYQTRRIFVMTPVVMRAMEEIRTYLDRLNKQMRIDSLKFTDSDYVAWLQSGRDRFNSFGKVSYITMLNAQGAIYHLWLVCSQITALRVKYLEEGLTSFNYSGSAVQLDVDVTQYIEGLLSRLEEELESNLRPLKEQMYKNSSNIGDGSQQIKGGYARGATGLSISPVTGAGHLGNRW